MLPIGDAQTQAKQSSRRIRSGRPSSCGREPARRPPRAPEAATQAVDLVPAVDKNELFYVHIRRGTGRDWQVGQVIEVQPGDGYWQVVEVDDECLVVRQAVLEPDFGPDDRRRSRLSVLGE